MKRIVDRFLVIGGWLLIGIIFIATLYGSVMLMRLGAFAESEMPSMQPEAGLVDDE